MPKPVKNQDLSKLERKHAKMLEEALKQPGVYDAMKVFENWQRADRGLDSYRLATKDGYRITTVDSTNPKQ